MRKITLLFLCTISATIMFAGAGWATTAIYLKIDGSENIAYKLNDENWTDGDWFASEAFAAQNFGTPTSLKLNGAAGNGWTDDSPGYTDTSFKLHYRVYLSSGTPGDWSTIDLTNLAYISGNNKIYNNINAEIDILALATTTGTNNYTLEVTMSKTQDWGSGTWTCMVPGGQGTVYDVATSGYIATFTKSITTGLDNTKKEYRITSNNETIKVNLEQPTSVKLFNINGQLLQSEFIDSEFTKKVTKGIYVLQLNGENHKIVVR